jgi:uncharacterized protein (DUF427 family)
MDELPDWVVKSRSRWTYTGKARPEFAVTPKPGQESVWDYPRPPRIAPDSREVVVRASGIEIARTTRAVRILETAGPPVFYIPPDDIDTMYVRRADGSSLCEWKGEAIYWSIILPDLRLERVAWSYPHPFPEYTAIRDYLSFYPGRVECTVGGVRVQPQPGRFYGGWITPEVVGTFKGEPGSENW